MYCQTVRLIRVEDCSAMDETVTCACAVETVPTSWAVLRSPEARDAAAAGSEEPPPPQETSAIPQNDTRSVFAMKRRMLFFFITLPSQGWTRRLTPFKHY